MFSEGEDYVVSQEFITSDKAQEELHLKMELCTLDKRWLFCSILLDWTKL